MMKKLWFMAAPFALLSAQEVIHDVLVQARPATNSVPAQQVKVETVQRGTVQFTASDLGAAVAVKNSPYSAEAVTETVQTLADGNKITRKNTVVQYRDGEGRMRREFELQAIGRLGDVEAGANKSISIDDPVAKVHYSLDLNRKTAFKMAGGEGTIRMAMPAGTVGGPARAAFSGNAVSADVMVTRTLERSPMPAVAEGAVPAIAIGPAASWTTADKGTNALKEEDLGSRNVEGVEAKGTRTVVTIPPGEVGNERALEIVSERWYSDQLKTFVLTRHADPRFGETTHRLTNVRLGEPPATLFEVPADFTVQEPQMRSPMMMRKRTVQE